MAGEGIEGQGGLGPDDETGRAVDRPDEDELDFELQPDELGDDRTGVIRAAADEFDIKVGHLAPGDERSMEAELALEFDKDEVELSPPQVLELDVSKLSTDAPVHQGTLLDEWRFYWVSFPVSLWTQVGRAFNRLEFKATFNEDDPDTSRPRTHDAIPARQFAELARADASLKVGVGGAMKFALQAPGIDLTTLGIPVMAKPDVHADVKADAGLVIGPLEYAVRTPIIQRSNLELDKVQWRLEGARMFKREEDPGLQVVLKVPTSTDHLRIRAAVRARRYVDSLDGTFLDAMTSMSRKVAYFFSRGAPIGDKRSWDLTDKL